MAEHAGLINAIGRFVLLTACADLVGWQTRYPPEDLGLAINVSSQEVTSATFVDGLESVLQSTGTSPGLLTIDITEGLFVRDREHALVVLNDLKDLGVRIALDDFGTGYSSLSYLSDFPIDVVKIDRSVVADLGVDKVSHIVVRSVVDVAHALDMTVTAEGVETAAQHREIATLGCDAGQGFYYARPMAADLIGSGADIDLPHRSGSGSRVLQEEPHHLP